MYRFLILVCLKTFLYASITDPISVCIIRVSFAEDSTSSTTGDGQFLMTNEGIDCGPYIIDPPPHDYDYFFSQLKSVDMYFQNVSYGKFGIDIPNSHIYPTSPVGSYQLMETMDYYNPYDTYYSPMIGAATLIGWTSLVSRRLQDMGRTGWWQAGLWLGQLPFFIFLTLVFTTYFNPVTIGLAVIFGLAYFGFVILIIVWLCLPPKEDHNKWGRNPLLTSTQQSNT